jgi:hypothetical protein
VTQIDALLLSILIEAALAAVLVGRWRAALAAALGTLPTQSAAWWAIPLLEQDLGYPAAILLVEAGVVLAEALGYRVIVPLRWPRALAVSLTANVVSAGFGLLLHTLSLT